MALCPNLNSPHSPPDVRDAEAGPSRSAAGSRATSAAGTAYKNNELRLVPIKVNVP